MRALSVSVRCLSVLGALVSVLHSTVKGGFDLRTEKLEDRGRQTAFWSPDGKKPNSVPEHSFFFHDTQVKSQRQLGQTREVLPKWQGIENCDADQHGSM